MREQTFQRRITDVLSEYRAWRQHVDHQIAHLSQQVHDLSVQVSRHKPQTVSQLQNELAVLRHSMGFDPPGLVSVVVSRDAEKVPPVPPSKKKRKR